MQDGNQQGSPHGGSGRGNTSGNGRRGPLTGLRVVELAGLGPAPYGCMLLADLGADVITVDRASPGLQLGDASTDLLRRGRRSIVVDLKQPEGRELVLRLVDDADVFVEGFRPGVAERLGVGPNVCRERNERLVYARMTGWGQDGPMAARAGHDLNYIALAGALAHIGRERQPPTPPLNLVGDFGGGAMFLVLGVLAGVIRARSTGQGDVVDVAMVDGVASLMTLFSGMAAGGQWNLSATGVNMLDSGLPTYDVYRTSDGHFVSVGALEPQFWAELRARLGLDDIPESAPYDRQQWPALRHRLSQVFATRSRDEWAKVFADSDACVVPVLGLDEAPRNPHLAERATFVEVDGIAQPAPAPRFQEAPAPPPASPTPPGRDTNELLAELGFGPADIERLRAAKVVA